LLATGARQKARLLEGKSENFGASRRALIGKVKKTHTSTGKIVAMNSKIEATFKISAM
jgi:hypothetical protein